MHGRLQKIHVYRITFLLNTENLSENLDFSQNHLKNLKIALNFLNSNTDIVHEICYREKHYLNFKIRLT